MINGYAGSYISGQASSRTTDGSVYIYIYIGDALVTIITSFACVID